MLTIGLLIIFLFGMIVIGIWGMRKTTTLGDFFLGNRSIGPWISAFSYGTSYFSAVLFIGFAGRFGWGFGLNAIWIAAGNTIFGGLLAWLVLGRRTRRMTQNLDVMTMPEFLEERFHAKGAKVIAASIIFVFLLPYSASVFKGLGHLFEANFNMSYDVALLIMIAITGIYIILGGYFAVTLTDFVQGLIMIVGSVAMVGVLVGNAGGFGATITAISEKYSVHIPPERQPSILLIMSLVFMTSFGTWGLPQMVQRFYSVKSEKMILKAAVVTTLFAFVITFAAYFTGAMTHIFYDTVPVKVQQVQTPKAEAVVSGQGSENSSAVSEKAVASPPPQADYDRIIPDLLKSKLPAALMAIILLLVLSASMSTLSSLVLVSSSCVAIDMYKGHINPQVSKGNSLAMMRFLSAIFVILSWLIARYEPAFIVTLMSLSWGAVAGSFMAPYLYGLFWKRATAAGVHAGMLSGLALMIVLFFVLGPANAPIAASIAMIAPFIVVPAVSAITRPPVKQLLDKAFDGV